MHEEQVGVGGLTAPSSKKRRQGGLILNEEAVAAVVVVAARGRRPSLNLFMSCDPAPLTAPS